MNLQKRFLLNLKITRWVKKRDKLKESSPWQTVDIQVHDNIIKKLENELKETSNA